MVFLNTNLSVLEVTKDDEVCQQSMSSLLSVKMEGSQSYVLGSIL